MNCRFQLQFRTFCRRLNMLYAPCTIWHGNARYNQTVYSLRIKKQRIDKRRLSIFWLKTSGLTASKDSKFSGNSFPTIISCGFLRRSKTMIISHLYVSVCPIQLDSYRHNDNLSLDNFISFPMYIIMNMSTRE